MAAYSRQKDIYSGLNKVSVQLLLFLRAHAALDVGAGSVIGHRTQCFTSYVRILSLCSKCFHI